MSLKSEDARSNAEKGHKMSAWISTATALPPEGKYVLVHLALDNYSDEQDPEGVYFTVAKLTNGITLRDRKRMDAGELPNPDFDGYKRSLVFCSEDEGGNNEKSYNWDTFGPDKYFGQDVDRWMPIPEHNE